MKTAVEYYNQEIKELFNMHQDGEISGKMFHMSRLVALTKAKEMEKKQIEDFFNAGVRYGSGSVMSTEWGEDTEEYNFEQYYNETFKSE